MKAIEYFAKYRELMFAAQNGAKISLENGKVISLPDEKTSNKIGVEFIREIDKELSERIKARRIRTDRALMAAIEEVGNLYDKVCDLFERDYGISPFKKGGYKKYIHEKVLKMGG